VRWHIGISGDILPAREERSTIHGAVDAYISASIARFTVIPRAQLFYEPDLTFESWVLTTFALQLADQRATDLIELRTAPTSTHLTKLLQIHPPSRKDTMGFFSSSSDKLPAPKISTDGTPIAPDRSARAKCWEARDIYFQCLDKNNIVDSLTHKDAAEKSCGAESKGFEANCASSWVSLLCLHDVTM